MEATRAAPALSLGCWAPRGRTSTSACVSGRAPAQRPSPLSMTGNAHGTRNAHPRCSQSHFPRPGGACLGSPSPRPRALAAASHRLLTRSSSGEAATQATAEASEGAAADAGGEEAAAGEGASSHSSLESVPALPFVDAASGAPAAFSSASGVYAIYDNEGALQYMGLSRRLNASLAIHLSELPELCGSVKLLEVSAPEKSVLIGAWKQWMEEHVAAAGEPPPGNASGNTTWTTRKAKRSGKPEIRLTPGRNTQLTVPLTELIDKVVKENKVVAFIKGTRTSPECGFSHRVLTLLNESNVDYELLNVLDEEHNPGLREAVKQYSQWPTIPQVYVGGEFLGGADILDQMAESGELKSILSK